MREAADAGARQRYFQHIFFPKSNGENGNVCCLCLQEHLCLRSATTKGASVPGIAHAIVLEHEA